MKMLSKKDAKKDEECKCFDIKHQYQLKGTYGSLFSSSI